MIRFRSAGVFLAGLLPVLGFVPFGFQRYSTVTDRYLYLSMLGPALAISRIVPAGSGGVKSVLAALMVILGVRCAFQTQIWRDNHTLFEYTLTVNPNSFVAHNNLGRVMIEENNPEKALVHLTQALRLKPEDEIIHNNIGLALADMNRLEEAVSHYEEALRIRPNYVRARNNLGIALGRMGRIPEAVTQFLAALQIDPNPAEVHYNLGQAFEMQGNLDEALRHYLRAQSLNPAHPQIHYNLSRVQEKLRTPR